MKFKFKKNQKVVCINTKSKDVCSIVEGMVYQIERQYACPSCHSRQYILKNYGHPITMICGCGYTEYRTQSYYEYRFRRYAPS